MTIAAPTQISEFRKIDSALICLLESLALAFMLFETSIVMIKLFKITYPQEAVAGKLE